MNFLKEVPRSRIVLAILIGFVAASMAFSGRPWRGYSAYYVHEIRTLPDGPALEMARRISRLGIFPSVEGAPAIDHGPASEPVKLGWSYVEYGILGMPYWARTEVGLVAFRETDEGIRFGQIEPERIPLLEQAGAGEIPRDYGFPWYRYIWGWLFFPLFGLWLWLWRKEDRVREAAHWGDETA